MFLVVFFSRLLPSLWPYVLLKRIYALLGSPNLYRLLVSLHPFVTR